MLKASTIRDTSNMSKLREYNVPDDRDRFLQVSIPALWLRDHTKPGDKLCIYEHPETHQLIIDIIPQSKEAS